MLLELAVILALIAANGVLAGSEISIISLRRGRILQLAAEDRRGARAVLALRDAPERFLATVQVGITVVGATAAAFSGASIAARIAPALERLGLSRVLSADLALAVAVALVSYLSLVFGELVPKSLALRSGERYALLVGRPLQALAWLARPAVWLLAASSNAVLRPFGDVTSFTESRLSAEELRQLVDEAGKTGALDLGSSEIASRALQFGGLTAGDVMVPRNHVVAIPREATPEEVRRLLLEHGHTRMPVFEGDLDNIVGYVTARDVLALLWERELVVLEDIVRPPLFVPESAPAVRVLQELQAKRAWCAVVVDEHGGASGLVTVEDLLEELVGELFSEYQVPEDLVRKQADGSAVVRGDVPIRDVNRALGIHLPEGETWTTVGGLCVSLAGAIPQVGTVLRAGEARLEVLEANPRLVRWVKVVADGERPAL
jgi:putative hemolysin